MRRPGHALFESAHAFAKTAHQFGYLSSAEQNQHDDRDDQPVHWEFHIASYACQPHLTTLLQNQAVITGRKLKYNTLVPGPARHPFPVQVFEQRDGILAGNPGQVLKNRHGNSLAVIFLKCSKLAL